MKVFRKVLTLCSLFIFALCLTACKKEKNVFVEILESNSEKLAASRYSTEATYLDEFKGREIVYYSYPFIVTEDESNQKLYTLVNQDGIKYVRDYLVDTSYSGLYSDSDEKYVVVNYPNDDKQIIDCYGDIVLETNSYYEYNLSVYRTDEQDGFFEIIMSKLSIDSEIEYKYNKVTYNEEEDKYVRETVDKNALFSFEKGSYYNEIRGLSYDYEDAKYYGKGLDGYCIYSSPVSIMVFNEKGNVVLSFDSNIFNDKSGLALIDGKVIWQRYVYVGEDDDYLFKVLDEEAKSDGKKVYKYVQLKTTSYDIKTGKSKSIDTDITFLDYFEGYYLDEIYGEDGYVKYLGLWRIGSARDGNLYSSNFSDQKWEYVIVDKNFKVVEKNEQIYYFLDYGLYDMDGAYVAQFYWDSYALLNMKGEILFTFDRDSEISVEGKVIAVSLENNDYCFVDLNGKIACDGIYSYVRKLAGGAFLVTEYYDDEEIVSILVFENGKLKCKNLYENPDDVDVTRNIVADAFITEVTIINPTKSILKIYSFELELLYETEIASLNNMLRIYGKNSNYQIVRFTKYGETDLSYVILEYSPIVEPYSEPV